MDVEQWARMTKRLNTTDTTRDRLRSSVDAEATQDQQHHLYELLRKFPTVMLGTYEQTGEQPSLRARPMAVSGLEQDCTLYFISSIDADKVDEAESVHMGHVFGQSKTRFFSLHGRVSVSQDRGRIRQLWSKANEVWFSGPEDPRVAVIAFCPEEAELWDASGVKGLKFLFKAARAFVGGAPPSKVENEQHERISLGR